MTDLTAALQGVRSTANREGVAKLAAEAGVPYTTVRSLAERGWSNKHLSTLEKLVAAAARLDAAAKAAAEQDEAA
jgi:hypothetical protein